MLGWELPPHNSGGLGMACYQLSKALSKKGVDIEFVLPYTAEHNIDFMKINAAHPQHVAEVIKSGIAYDSFKYITKDGEVQWVDMIGQSAIYEEAVGKIAELAEFDVIHAHDWLTCRAGLRARMVSGKPLIIHIHSIEADRSGQPYGGNPIVREIEAVSLMMSDHIIAVSQHTKDGIVREYGIPADKIEVIHNSIDPSDLAPLDGNNAYRYLDAMKSLGYRVVVNVGRLSVQKGLVNLLQSYAKAVQYAPKSFLLIVGSGEQYYELISLAADLGIGDKVLFTDFQRGKNWRDAFAIGDIFVMPSISEPFGITPLEAIGYGTPALISKQSGVSEVLRNVLKVDFWDVDEMANKMAGVLNNDALRDELHVQSYNELRNFSWDESAEKLLSTYKKHKMGAVV